MDGDQADGPLALERTEPFHDLAGRQAELAVARHFDGDEIAVLRAAGVAGGNRRLAAKLLLVDRYQPTAAVRQAAKNTEHAVLGAVDEFYDAAANLLFICLLDAQQRAVANAGNFPGPRTPRYGNMDDRRRAVRLFVPFCRPRQ